MPSSLAILMYVFSYSVSPAATNDRAEWRLVPTLVFQEFSSEERRRAAKATLEGSLKEAGAKLKSGLLEDLKSAGKADPAQIILPTMWNAFRNEVNGRRPRGIICTFTRQAASTGVFKDADALRRFAVLTS